MKWKCNVMYANRVQYTNICMYVCGCWHRSVFFLDKRRVRWQATYPDNKSQTDSLFAQEDFCIRPLHLATNDIHLSDCHLRASEKSFGEWCIIIKEYTQERAWMYLKRKVWSVCLCFSIECYVCTVRIRSKFNWHRKWCGTFAFVTALSPNRIQFILSFAFSCFFFFFIHSLPLSLSLSSFSFIHLLFV